jgi:hypothetical protein
MNQKLREKLAPVTVLVNRARKALGLKRIPELLPGEQGVSDRCALAMSIDSGVHIAEEGRFSVPRLNRAVAKALGTEVLRENGRAVGFVLPDLLDDFVTDFDEGKYPDLIVEDELEPEDDEDEEDPDEDDDDVIDEDDTDDDLDDESA